MKMIAYVQAAWCKYERKWEFTVCHFEDMQQFGQTCVGSHEFEFDAPPVEVLTAETIAAYRKEQEKIRAEAHKKVMELQDSIDAMLCLEHKPEAA